MKKEHEAWKEAKIPISTAVNPVSPHAVHVVVVVGCRCRRRGATLNRQGVASSRAAIQTCPTNSKKKCRKKRQTRVTRCHTFVTIDSQRENCTAITWLIFQVASVELDSSLIRPQCQLIVQVYVSSSVLLSIPNIRSSIPSQCSSLTHLRQ
jgi:hypothetical protein